MEGKRKRPQGGACGRLLKSFCAGWLEDLCKLPGPAVGLRGGDLMENNHVGRIPHVGGCCQRCERRLL